MYKTHRINTIFKNTFIELQNNDVENLTNNYQFKHIKMIENGSITPGSAIICEMNNKFLLLKNYRYGVDKECIEVPRGYIEKNEDIVHCAIRELCEEISIAQSSIISTEILGHVNTNSSILASNVAIVHIKLLHDCVLSVQRDESITDYYWYSIDEIKNLIARNIILDSFSISGFMLYMIKK